MMAPQAMSPQGTPWYSAPQRECECQRGNGTKRRRARLVGAVWLFMFKVALVLAFLSGVLAAIASR
jgi:hypothetical protein